VSRTLEEGTVTLWAPFRHTARSISIVGLLMWVEAATRTVTAVMTAAVTIAVDSQLSADLRR
jgi:hypothetical protein